MHDARLWTCHGLLETIRRDCGNDMAWRHMSSVQEIVEHEMAWLRMITLRETVEMALPGWA